jgi:hypothetical protein
MVKFQKAALATTAVLSDEGATAAVALPHLASNRRRHMPSARWRRPHRARPLDPRELPSLKILEQRGERAIEDDRRIAVWHDVPEQVLHVAQLVVGRTADGELYFVTLRRQRADDSSRRTRRCGGVYFGTVAGGHRRRADFGWDA